MTRATTEIESIWKSLSNVNDVIENLKKVINEVKDENKIRKIKLENAELKADVMAGDLLELKEKFNRELNKLKNINTWVVQKVVPVFA